MISNHLYIGSNLSTGRSYGSIAVWLQASNLTHHSTGAAYDDDALLRHVLSKYNSRNHIFHVATMELFLYVSAHLVTIVYDLKNSTISKEKGRR